MALTLASRNETCKSIEREMDSQLCGDRCVFASEKVHRLQSDIGGECIAEANPANRLKIKIAFCFAGVPNRYTRGTNVFDRVEAIQ